MSAQVVTDSDRGRERGPSAVVLLAGFCRWGLQPPGVEGHRHPPRLRCPPTPTPPRGSIPHLACLGATFTPGQPLLGPCEYSAGHHLQRGLGGPARWRVGLVAGARGGRGGQAAGQGSPVPAGGDRRVCHNHREQGRTPVASRDARGTGPGDEEVAPGLPPPLPRGVRAHGARVHDSLARSSRGRCPVPTLHLRDPRRPGASRLGSRGQPGESGSRKPMDTRQYLCYLASGRPPPPPTAGDPLCPAIPRVTGLASGRARPGSRSGGLGAPSSSRRPSLWQASSSPSPSFLLDSGPSQRSTTGPHSVL